MVEEKAQNIIKNHIGFIAKDVAEYMPKEFENIVIYDNDAKKLNYIHQDERRVVGMCPRTNG